MVDDIVHFDAEPVGLIVSHEDWVEIVAVKATILEVLLVYGFRRIDEPFCFCGWLEFFTRKFHG